MLGIDKIERKIAPKEIASITIPNKDEKITTLKIKLFLVLPGKGKIFLKKLLTFS
ncbi:hypothetical protein JCM19000A_31170 [Silvimonas sp. JCM 19000]